MLTIGICIVVGFLLGWLSDKEYKHRGIVGRIKGFLIGGIIGVLLALIIGAGALQSEKTNDYVLEEYNLIGMEDTSSVSASGSHFFVIGHYNSDLEFYYTYHYEDSQGAIRFDKKDAESSKVAIYESNREDAVLRIVAPRKTWQVDEHLSLWGLHFATEGENIREWLKKYEFHVPEGTVKRDFSVDRDK